MEQSPFENKAVLPGPPARSVLPTLYAGAIIVAALYYGRELMVPLVLAALLAFVLAPGCALLQRIRVPRIAAVLVVVSLSFVAIVGIGTIVGGQAASLAVKLPAYRTTVITKWDALREDLNKLQAYAGRGEESHAGDHRKASGVEGSLGLDDMSGLTLAKAVALPILSPLTTVGIVLIFTLFILISNEDLRDRLVRLVGRNDLHRTILAMNEVARRLSRFFLFQLALNTTFGAVVGIALWIGGLPSPLLWGLLAAAMRFVPFIGVFIAAIPPLLLAVAIVPGWSLVLYVLVLFVVAEMVMGQVVEPLVYGHNTGLSPLAVIVATAFWALLWGPIGLLIATPLTVCLVVLGRHVETLAFLDIVLGDTPPLDPNETLYQRALEGRGALLVADARKRIAASTVADYYDKVALPGLALAQGDLARDSLAFERLETVHEEISMLLAALGASVNHAGAAAAGRTVLENAILCIPGRGQLDDLATRMAVHTLHSTGFDATLVSNAALGSAQTLEGKGSIPEICCLSILEHGSSVAAIRYFITRLQKRLPHITIVVGLWHVHRDSPLLWALREEGGQEHVVLSLGELVAFCRVQRERSQFQREPPPLLTAAT